MLTLCYLITRCISRTRLVPGQQHWLLHRPGSSALEERDLSKLSHTLPRPAGSPAHAAWSGLQEFENAEGDEYSADLAQGSPATTAQNGPDVYVLPLTEVSLPMAKQPGRSGSRADHSHGADVLGRLLVNQASGTPSSVLEPGWWVGVPLELSDLRTPPTKLLAWGFPPHFPASSSGYSEAGGVSGQWEGPLLDLCWHQGLLPWSHLATSPALSCAWLSPESLAFTGD
ncbi:hypothetical protein P7K49_012048 [Saguinus oedipus]|uniref:Uncharacterized protein n=1 Tax=Saguinus oedipus TaxID=9490 RepID=A0ABQ9VSD2_SAGOE|nr:hypothetical protein P7K49_012048 [Saguinus oedipus]